ncbi:hypothetical protein KY331_06215 [Candidatus Woesearchaeota archaeon]|nr:hypothetical protein [Candidatus Woesearchaeota archaeon]
MSLKYTRTVDVIRSVIERMLNAFEFSVNALIEKKQARKKKLVVPTQIILKCKLVKEEYDDEKLVESLDFYLRLREILKAKYTRREEYRRYVTMISELGPGDVVEVGIDQLNEYHKIVKEFVEYIEGLIK